MKKRDRLHILVLAAGQGSRMKSALPKVLHPVVGYPMLGHILKTAQALRPERIGVVVGVGKEQVQATIQKIGFTDVDFIHQPIPRGSGDAVRQARSWLSQRSGTLLIVYGDTPLLQVETLQSVLKSHRKENHAATFLGMEPSDPSGYGRLLRDKKGSLLKIVEDRDANIYEKRIRQVNSGVACWSIPHLLKALGKLKPNNAKKEYYLTDAVALFREAGLTVGAFIAPCVEETLGVNTRVELAEAERIFRARLVRQWMLAGVTFDDPATTYLESTVTVGADTRIGPGCILKGKTKIASGCDIAAYSILEDAEVKTGAKIGPFARLRPGAQIGEGAHIGNFVEIKKSKIGKGSKANHLTYLGDSIVGQGVNVGAGTITCNYDGKRKHATIIEDQVFIGSNTNLVAPIRVGKGAVIAAGSTLTDNVPKQSLAIARSRQTNKTNWVRK